MLLLLLAGAKSGSTPLKVTKCCFQPSAFQNNAFQNCAATKKKVGWPDTLRRRIPRKDLERLLELQKNNTFGRRWFREFERAQKQFAQDEGRAALAEAAREARLAADKLTDRRPLGGLLQLAAETKNYDLAGDITKLARQVNTDAEFLERSRRMRDEADDEAALLALLGAIEPKTDDDDEAILILLH